MLHLIGTDRLVAPESALKIISGGCKVGCTRSCRCRKAGLFFQQYAQHVLDKHVVTYIMLRQTMTIKPLPTGYHKDLVEYIFLYFLDIYMFCLAFSSVKQTLCLALTW